MMTRNVYVVFILIAGMYFLCVSSGSGSAAGNEVFDSQQECEQITELRCGYQMCDYIPEGKTFDEVCGRNFKEGWAPSPYMFSESASASVELYSIVLTIEAPFSTAILTIKGNGQMIYEASAEGQEDVREEKFLTSDEMFLLTGTLQDVKFTYMEERYHPDPSQAADQSVYTVEAEIRTFVPGVQQKTRFEGVHSVGCYQDNCNQGLLKLKDRILQLWGKPVAEIGV